jgi:hypothetical protein
MRPFLLLLAMSAPSIAEIPPKEYWPKKVTLSKSFTVEQKLPNGVAKKEFREGDKVDLVSVFENQIEIRSGLFSTRLAHSDTDFAEISKEIQSEAIAAKLKRENEERERIQMEVAAKEAQANREEKAVESAGNPILKNSNESISLDPEIYEAIKSKLKDPLSFQPRELISKNLIKVSDDSYVWRVRIRYGAKNGFGGYTLGNATILYKAGKAVVEDFD